MFLETICTRILYLPSGIHCQQCTYQNCWHQGAIYHIWLTFKWVPFTFMNQILLEWLTLLLLKWTWRITDNNLYCHSLLTSELIRRCKLYSRVYTDHWQFGQQLLKMLVPSVGLCSSLFSSILWKFTYS